MRSITAACRWLVRLAKRLKEYVAERPALKIACGALLLLAALYVYRLINPRLAVFPIMTKSFPLFLNELEKGTVNEALIRGSSLYYLSSNLFQTKAASMSNLQLSDLLK